MSAPIPRGGLHPPLSWSDRGVGREGGWESGIRVEPRTHIRGERRGDRLRQAAQSHPPLLPTACEQPRVPAPHPRGCQAAGLGLGPATRLANALPPPGGRASGAWEARDAAPFSCVVRQPLTASFHGHAFGIGHRTSALTTSAQGSHSAPVLEVLPSSSRAWQARCALSHLLVHLMPS